MIRKRGFREIFDFYAKYLHNDVVLHGFASAYFLNLLVNSNDGSLF